MQADQVRFYLLLGISSGYVAEIDTTEDESKAFKHRVRRNTVNKALVNPEVVELTQCIETPDLEESLASEVSTHHSNVTL